MSKGVLNMLVPQIIMRLESLYRGTPNRLLARLLMVIAFVILLASPGFGQTDYSDAWVDDSNPDAPLIVAAGVTDYDYSADEVGVEITLTSPQGRMASGGDDNYGFAVAEVTLPWDWLDLGSYTLTTVHQPLCE